MRSLISAAGFALILSGCQAAAPEPDKGAETATAPGMVPVATQIGAPEPEPRIPEGPSMKAEPVAVSETPCRTAIGEKASARLVARCIAVSPATRPPCNAANPCDLIQGEIDRSCNQYAAGEVRPAECVG